MSDVSPRNLRTSERYLLVPPLQARFGATAVAVSDISTGGARFRHETPLETGKKGVLEISPGAHASAVSLEAVVMWSHSETKAGGFVSGVRTYGNAESIQSLLATLHSSRRSNRIEELRSADRFFIMPAIEGSFGGVAGRIENLSARGARIISDAPLEAGQAGVLLFRVPDSPVEVTAKGRVAWTGVKAISGSDRLLYRTGLAISEKPELMRLAIGQLSELDFAALDTQSLGLKLKILRARARQVAPSAQVAPMPGIPAEQILLVQSVREELRVNPEEALHWYRRARIVINDPQTRAAAPMIADYPDALAVWEYLDRSVDPTIVGRALHLPLGQ